MEVWRWNGESIPSSLRKSFENGSATNFERKKTDCKTVWVGEHQKNYDNTSIDMTVIMIVMLTAAIAMALWMDSFVRNNISFLLLETICKGLINKLSLAVTGISIAVYRIRLSAIFVRFPHYSESSYFLTVIFKSLSKSVSLVWHPSFWLQQMSQRYNLNCLHLGITCFATQSRVLSRRKKSMKKMVMIYSSIFSPTCSLNHISL